MSDIVLMQKAMPDLLRARAEGKPLRDAAKTAGVNRNTVYTWLRIGQACRVLSDLKGAGSLSADQQAFLAFLVAFETAVTAGRKVRLGRAQEARAPEPPPVNWYTGQPLVPVPDLPQPSDGSPPAGPDLPPVAPSDLPSPDLQPAYGETIEGEWGDVSAPS